MIFLQSQVRTFVACAAMALGLGCSGALTTNIDVQQDAGGGGIQDSSSASPGADAAVVPDSGRPGGTCTTDADCSAAKICAFKMSDGCPAAGVCFDAPAPSARACQLFSPGCACDGTEINLACNGYPGGYASKPLLHTGACSSPPADAGPTSCESDSDCGTGRLCAFKITDGCSAAGACFTPPPPGPTCDAYSPACSCSGTTLNVICTNYANGYASRPIAYRGSCEAAHSDDGGGLFACGSATCTMAQVCKVGMGGAPNKPTSYTCVDVPAQCASTHTCACVKSALGAQDCAESGGDVTVTFLYP